MSAIRNSFLLTIMLAAASVARAGDWPQWRGPFFNGSTDERDLPSRWSKTENIAWKVELPRVAAAVSSGLRAGADDQCIMEGTGGERRRPKGRHIYVFLRDGR